MRKAIHPSLLSHYSSTKWPGHEPVPRDPEMNALAMRPDQLPRILCTVHVCYLL